MAKEKPLYFIFDQSSSTNELIVDSDNSPYAVDLTLTSINVVGETRRMRATWTVEDVQNLQTFQYQPFDFSEESIRIHRSFVEKATAKRRRYKDRKMYIKMLEEWSGEKVNKGNGGIES